ncbi:hypothetical protein RRG08_065335 [Elysia crispata]|uniref:Uncharacterized protein n=1 Tax=Elysia crispata TaxID=231223 RepID=A0AAE0YKB4_9GAST|nr:hypothetical protein RRG08_065335 [Elysia crispata]
MARVQKFQNSQIVDVFRNLVKLLAMSCSTRLIPGLKVSEGAVRGIKVPEGAAQSLNRSLWGKPRYKSPL